MKKHLALLTLLTLALLACTTNKTPSLVSFEELDSGTKASLRGLFVVDEKVVWASGSGGTVILTTDGGTSWKDVSVPGAEENDFRSLHAFDEKRAMVFGVAGPDFGYLTEDAGESWEVFYSDTTAGLFFNSLKFADELHGLAVSDPIDGKFFVLRTDDGGNSWSRITEIPDVIDGEANFAASNTCIEFLPSGKAWIASGGMAARVFYSDDYGKNWSVTSTPMIRGSASAGIFSLAFKNGREGMIVGGIYNEPEINTNIAAYTTDGGVTWLPAKSMPTNYRSCVQFLSNESDTFAFAIGKTGCDISMDGGRNWQLVSEEGYYTFRAVPGQALGFAAGSEGRIARINFRNP